MNNKQNSDLYVGDHKIKVRLTTLYWQSSLLLTNNYVSFHRKALLCLCLQHLLHGYHYFLVDLVLLSQENFILRFFVPSQNKLQFLILFSLINLYRRFAISICFWFDPPSYGPCLFYVDLLAHNFVLPIFELQNIHSNTSTIL